MKILHVITGLGGGGAEGVLYRLIKNEKYCAHHVVSLTGPGRYERDLPEAGALLTTLDMPRGLLTIRGFTKLLKVLRSWKPDVMQTWMYHSDLVGGIAGLVCGVPVVWGIRNTVLERGKSSLSSIWAAKLCAWGSRYIPDRIVVCAQAAVDVHASLGYDVRRMVLIANGYELSLIKPSYELPKGRLSEWRTLDGVPLIGMVARFDPYKDHDNLLSALADLNGKGVKFLAVLVGSGVEARNEHLMEMIHTYGLTECVTLLGPRDDVYDIMGKLDIHVLSSSAEAFPNVLAEAMACGTPCVTTDVGDAADIVGETGWIVPPRDSAALASALQDAIIKWHYRTEWVDRQRRCRYRIEQNYSVERMVFCYREVWREVSIRHSSCQRGV